MNTMDANALLRAYVQEDSETAFQELVNRWLARKAPAKGK
jgi:hypothetical protein